MRTSIFFAMIIRVFVTHRRPRPERSLGSELGGTWKFRRLH